MAGVLLLFIIFGALNYANAVMVCYYGSWASYRTGDGNLSPQNIDPFLCSHLIYAFAGINPTSSQIMVLDPWNDLSDAGGKGGYTKFTQLKAANPALKTLLAVGGWNEGSHKFATMSADATKRKRFITSVVALLRQFNFDGVDIDWEYPNGNTDKRNLLVLLNELRQALAPLGLLLTIAVSADDEHVVAGYDVPGISRYVDYIHVMTYDFHGPYEGYTHHNAPLRAHPADASHGSMNRNVEYAISFWLSMGAPRNKLVLGLAAYGHCYVISSGQTGFYASSSGPAPGGPYTQQNGFMGYSEICRKQSEEGSWISVNDPNMNEPYTYDPVTRVWCGYDDSRSIALKVRFGVDKGLAGAMVWSLDMDDIQGKCRGNRAFELVRVAVEEMKTSTSNRSTTTEGTTTTSASTSTPTSTSSTTTTAATSAPTSTTSTTTITSTTRRVTTTTTPLSPNCTSGQTFYPHLYCNKYYWCYFGTAHEYACVQGLYWNPLASTCDWPQNVDTSQCITPRAF